MDEKHFDDKSSGLPFHEPSHMPPSEDERPHRTLRAELNAFLGEFVGTFMFLSMAFTGTQIALNAAGTNELTSSGKPDVDKLLYISFAFGVSLAVNVAIFADISGGKFNPAVSPAPPKNSMSHQPPLLVTHASQRSEVAMLMICATITNLRLFQVTTALFITGKIHWHRALQTIIAQMIAGIAAAGFVAAVLPGPLIVATTLDQSMSITRGLFLEAFVTSQLVLTILMLETGPSKPAYIGFALFVAHMSCVFFTGGALNPARSFGPACIVGFTSYHWIYWLGPLLGSLVASGEYFLINFLRKTV